MSVTVRVDSSRMQRYLRDLQGTLPVTIDEIIRAETGTILKECVLRTKVAPMEKVSIRARASGNQTIRRQLYRAGSKVARGEMWRGIGARTQSAEGRVWYRVPRGGGAKFVLLYGTDGADIWGAGRPKQMRGRNGIGIAATKSQYPSRKLMNRGQSFRMLTNQQTAQAMKAGKEARGLGRQSWVHIADAAGIVLESVRGGRNASAAIAKARTAMARNGKRYMNGAARFIGSAFKRVLRINNLLPYAKAARMDSVLAGVIAGRIGYAERVFKKGILTKAHEVARAYPNIRVNTNS